MMPHLFKGHLWNRYFTIRSTFFALFCLLSLGITGVASGQNDAFVESGGLIVVETESLELIGEWALESIDAGYTGSGYIRWNGENYLNDPGHGTLAVHVKINDPGDYNVRMRISHLGAPAGDQWNDAWVKMNNGTWVKVVHPADRMNEGFTFHSPTEPSSGVFDQMRYNLTAGEHTFYISGRSTNFRIDRIHFYKDSVADPLNTAYPESARTASDGGGGDGGENNDTPASVTISGEQKKWHPITITLDGPQASEGGSPNPFLDYRFEVTFSQGTHSYTVPGYFAADGNASESSATSGNKWRAHFVPDRVGNWDYVVSMRSGTNISVDINPAAGTPTTFDGMSGSFSVSESDKTGADHRGKGKLRYVGKHYLQFDNGDYFIKGGADSPENFLAYEDFDGTYNNAGTNFVKSYTPHIGDWGADDPSWQGGKGKGIIGALNYLSSKGMNVVYFITMNIQGDGQDVWPWTGPGERVRFDVSKLDQWNVVFDHMDRVGIMLHVLTQETENELLLNNGALGRERKLYYRELVARFGYHQAITWNLGEENDGNTDAQRKEFASYIRSLDPYDHPIVVHTYSNQYDQTYNPLLGYTNFEGTSLQIADMTNVHGETLKWYTRSEENGRPWIVNLDEIGPYQIGVTEDGPGNNHDQVRKYALWANLMAGGGGVEWYFGYDTASHDLNTENWRTRDNMWDYTFYAMDFFQSYLPFTEMAPADNLTPKANDYVFAKTGSVYAVYTPDGGNLSIDLADGEYSVRWYDPRVGGGLLQGNVSTVNGPGVQNIGSPPSNTSADWVALIRNTSGEMSQPTLSVSRTTIDFGAVMPAASKSLPLTLTNNGNADLNVTSFEISGNDAGSFETLQNPAPFNLAPGQSQIVNFLFAPGVNDTGVKNATLQIASNDPARGLLSVVLTGRAEANNEDGNGGGDDGGNDGDNGGGEGASTISVIGFTLIDALTGEELGPVNNGDLIDLSKLPTDKINIRAETDPPEVGSVQFSLNRNANFQMENSSPYSMAGDIGTDYNSWTPLPGAHQLIARPFSSRNGTGAQGRALQINFFISSNGELPSTIELDQNYPNPFSRSTTITVTLKKPAETTLKIYDMMGREVAVLADRLMPAGTLNFHFDAKNLRSGTYFYRLNSNGFVETRKMILIK